MVDRLVDLGLREELNKFMFIHIKSFSAAHFTLILVFSWIGGYYDKRVIEITGCYAVPYSEAKEEPEINVQYNKDMYDMTQRAVPTEVPVGW